MRHRYILFLFFMMLPLTFMGQRRRAAKVKEPVIPATELARAAIDKYAFNQAEEILTKEMEALKKKRKDTSHLQSLLQEAREGANRLHATERVVIIDSIICPADEALKAIKLSQESGRLDTYASTYHERESLGNTLFENEFGNKRYLATNDFRLATSDKVGDKWSTPTLLTGLHDEEDADKDDDDEEDEEKAPKAATSYIENYPFLLSDGITLYFAATGDESMGGYDIFVTRADGEGGAFLTPENVGYPFNSKANDYLLVIDELSQLGWFVSDRFQPKDTVCVYIFIPNETRQVYGDEVTEPELQALARLTSIRDSWPKDDKENAVPQALERLNKLRNARPTTHATTSFTFIVDDQRIYHNPTEFRSATARQKIVKWQELSKNVATDTEMLQRMRDSYAKANAQERQRQAPALRKLEEALETQVEELHQLTKDIRNAEISNP